MKRLALISTLAACLAAPVALQADNGTIHNRGSDTLFPIAQAWATAYQSKHPETAIDVRGCGSDSGFLALINKTAHLASSSRAIKKKELTEAEKNGVSPREHLVGYDALSILVNKANPVSWISVPSLAEVYGEKGTLDDWNKLGVAVPGCPKNKITVVGRQVGSGTHLFFQETVLGKQREFKHDDSVMDVHDSNDVPNIVAQNPCAIGYVGMAYEAPDVKKLKISKDRNTAVIDATMTTAIDGTYPIARPLFMYTNGEPEGRLKAYLDWIKSDEGQCMLIEKGYAPVRHVACGGR
ncbi:MAG: PstS family phosphate ABC transporter substrate-binding protein [Magnetococcales bacterium]|nr:PstS family phosphate ABC transporter substrate-binding protein [Magnetococcales bacterium]